MRIKLLIIGLFISLGVSGQEPTALSNLIEEALSKNYQIRILRNEELVDINNNTYGNAGFLPTVSASGATSTTINNTIQQFFNGDVREGNNAKSSNLNGLVRADWIVFDGFRMFANRDQLELMEQMGRSETRFFIDQTIGDIAELYYQLVAAKSRLENLRQSLDISRFRYDLEGKKLRVGASNALLYNQALIDYNTDSIQVLDLRRSINSLEIQVNRLLNRDPSAEVFTSAESVWFDELNSVDSLVKLAISSNQQLQLSRFNELLAETGEKILKASLYPEVSVFGQFAYNRSLSEIGFVELNRSYGSQYGLSVRFNLFNGGNTRREIRNQEVQKENSRLQSEDIQQDLTSSITELYNQYQFWGSQLNIAEANVEAAQKSQVIAREQLEKQAISGYDFRLTQLSVINAFNSVTQIKQNLKLVQIQILRLTGTLANTYL